jgi:hypothetical protein
MTDKIQEAIAKAQAAAGTVATAAAGTTAVTGTAVVPAASTAVAAALPPGKKVSMEQLMTGGMNVDLWVKVKEFGLIFGQSDELISTFVAIIDMTDGVGFSPKYSIKAGNPAQYWSTYDGVMSDKGIPWSAAIERACSLDNKARPYSAVDIPMVLTEDVVSPKKVVLAKKGQRVGYATSTTGFREWRDFYNKATAEGLLDQQVEVQVSFRKMKNKEGNEWGVMTFEPLGVYSEEHA